MTPVELVVTRATRAGVADADAAFDVGSGFTIPDNDGNITLRVSNPDASAHSITITATASLAGSLFPATTVVVPAGATRTIGPWPPVLYNDQVNAVGGVADAELQLFAQGI